MPRTKDFAKRQLWKNRLAQFQASRLSVAQFCRSVGCSVPSFYVRRRKLEGTRSLPPFLKIQIPDHRAPTIEVKPPSAAGTPTDEIVVSAGNLHPLTRRSPRLPCSDSGASLVRLISAAPPPAGGERLHCRLNAAKHGFDRSDKHIAASSVVTARQEPYPLTEMATHVLASVLFSRLLKHLIRITKFH
jgi:hypothetical protein